MLNFNAFKHAAIVRQILLSVKTEEVVQWPIFNYLKQASVKKEAMSLLFEFIKIYSEIKPCLDIGNFLITPLLEKRYLSWQKVAQSSSGRRDFSIVDGMLAE